MVDTLLHWHCQGTTYSVKRMTIDTAFLIITTTDGRTLHGRRPIPVSLVDAWRDLSVDDRCRHAEEEIERREAARPTP